jgi:hypothetical protein
MDFTYLDNASLFPIRINEGGESYGFCPAKAYWDSRAVELSKIMVVTAETGALYHAGGIADQPAWYTDIASWFLIRYDYAKFAARVKAVIGDNSNGVNVGRITNQRNGKK